MKDVLRWLQYFPVEFRPQIFEKILVKQADALELTLRVSGDKYFFEDNEGTLYQIPVEFLSEDKKLSAVQVSAEVFETAVANALLNLSENVSEFNKAFGNLLEISPESAIRIIKNFFDNFPKEFYVEVVVYAHELGKVFEFYIWDSRMLITAFFIDCGSPKEICSVEFDKTFQYDDELFGTIREAYTEFLEDILLA